MTDFEKAHCLNEWQEANYPLSTLAKHRLMKMTDADFEVELDRLAIEYREGRYE